MTRRLVAAGLVLGLGSVSGCGATGSREPVDLGLAVPSGDVVETSRVAHLVGCEPRYVSAFVKLDSDFGAGDLAALGAGGRVPLLTFEPWSWQSRHGDAEDPAYALRRLVEGAWDEELLRFADVLATHDGEVMVRFAHEMNADWYPWGLGANGNAPHHYVAAWRHVHRLVSQRAPDVTWVWAPVAAWWPDAVPLRALWPGDDVVDVVGVTGYAREDLAADTAEETFGDWYDEVDDLTDRPMLLAEVGASGPGRTAWIDSLEPFLEARPDVEGLVWFNTSPETTGATGDYRLDDDPAALDAFRSLLGSLDPECRTPSDPSHVPTHPRSTP